MLPMTATTRPLTRQRICPAGPARACGSSLVEVLIALVVIAVGLLGLAGLQLNSVQSANSSAQRFEASLLAQNILERMRANRQQAMQGGYQVALGEIGGGSGLAGNDLAEWKGQLAQLPDGNGSIEMDDNLVTIVIQWTNADANNARGAQTSVLRLRSEL